MTGGVVRTPVRAVELSPGLPVDLLADDVRVAGVTSGLVDRDQHHGAEVEALLVEHDRRVRIADRGDDRVALLACGLVVGAKGAQRDRGIALHGANAPRLPAARD